MPPARSAATVSLKEWDTLSVEEPAYLDSGITVRSRHARLPCVSCYESLELDPMSRLTEKPIL